MTRPTFILGDIHGDYAGLLAIIDERKIRDSVVIHVGDGREGFPEGGLPVLETLNQEFDTRGIEYLSIRGNRCNPTFFEGDHLLSKPSGTVDGHDALHRPGSVRQAARPASNSRCH